MRSALFIMAVMVFFIWTGSVSAQPSNNADADKSTSEQGTTNNNEQNKADPKKTNSGNDPDAQQKEEADASATLKAVLDEVKSVTSQSRGKLKEREAKFRQRRDKSKQQLAQANAKLNRLESDGAALEASFDAKKTELDEKTKLLKDKIGALKELFGVFQQNASDLIGAFNGSPTSIQYPNRQEWLEGFANRMKNASEVSSADDIKGLWFEMQREITASSNIVRLSAPVRKPGEDANQRDFIRVGNFNLITNEPDPSYLVWDAGTQQVLELDRQPDSEYLSEIRNYVKADQGLHQLGIDPSGGALLSLLVEKPTLEERVDQGGQVGYMILGLGAVAFVLALFKLLEILFVGARVRAQRRNLDNPKSSNALGRVLAVYNDNQHVDTETLEMRLHEQVAKESTRVNRFIVFLGIIAAVAPLMGLLGTVVGMINTFQAITLYGTGDPQTMAGGISQALITTVLGLVVAVPTVLLHAIVGARAKAVINILHQQVASLAGDQMQARSDRITNRESDINRNNNNGPDTAMEPTHT